MKSFLDESVFYPLLRLPRHLPHCHSHLGLIPLRSGDCLSRRIMDGSMQFAVDHWWSNQVQSPHHVRGSVSEGTTSCTCRTLPEQNSSIRCWTAAKACSAELFRYLACTVSLSRLTHLASNKVYCRGSTLKHQHNQMLRYHARSVGSGTTESVRATRGSTTQDGTDATHGCCAMLFLFSWLDTERLPGRAVITSLVSMRSACAVSRSVTRCVLRVLRSPEHTITTNALYVSDSAGNVSCTNPKEKLGFEQQSGATDFRSKSYRVPTCSFPTDIRFRS